MIILARMRENAMIHRMVLCVPISQEADAKLAAKARAAGVDLSTYVATLVEEMTGRPLSLDEITANAAKEFAQSGMTEDELGDFLEEVKHDVRASRRTKAA
jgi:hypothetical protein